MSSLLTSKIEEDSPNLPELFDDDIKKIDQDENIKKLNKDQGLRKREVNNLIVKLNECKTGNKKSKDNQTYSAMFEQICCDIVNLIFKEHSNKYSTKAFLQTRQYRFFNISDSIDESKNQIKHSIKRQKRIKDIIYPLNISKKNNLIGVWDKLVNSLYDCQRLVFECKNYGKSKITDKEIYQLYEYLDPSKDGKVGIIFCRKKTLTENAHGVINRLKDDHYIIILLDEKDIKKWLNEYTLNPEPSIYFNEVFNRADSLYR